MALGFWITVDPNDSTHNQSEPFVKWWRQLFLGPCVILNAPRSMLARNKRVYPLFILEEDYTLFKIVMNQWDDTYAIELETYAGTSYASIGAGWDFNKILEAHS